MRAGSLAARRRPTAWDRHLCTRFGVSAVELIAAEQYGYMVALTGTGIEPVLLTDAIDRIRTVPPDGELVRTARGAGDQFRQRITQDSATWDLCGRMPAARWKCLVRRHGCIAKAELVVHLCQLSAWKEGTMFTIDDEATDAVYGTLDETQLQFLMDHLEEESAEDTDFYINQATVDMLEQDGADAALVTSRRGRARRARGHGYPLGPDSALVPVNAVFVTWPGGLVSKERGARRPVRWGLFSSPREGGSGAGGRGFFHRQLPLFTPLWAFSGAADGCIILPWPWRGAGF